LVIFYSRIFIYICSIKAKLYGATVEVSYDEYDHCDIIEVIAPEGYQWNEGDCQIMVGYLFQYDEDKASVYEDLIHRMEFGLDPYKED